MFARTMRVAIVALAVCAFSLVDTGCAIRIAQQPVPVPPAPLPAPTAPVPTVIPAPVPTVLPAPVPPALPPCTIEITRASTLEVCGYVACQAGYTTTAPVTVVLESAVGTAGITVTAALGGAIPANMPALTLGIPVPAGSENTAFRFDLSQAPYPGNAAVGSGQPVVVAIPPTVAGGADQARSRVVFLRERHAIHAHIFSATADCVRGCIGISNAVSITAVDVQLFALSQPGDPTTTATSGLVPLGVSNSIATTGTTPPAWAPQPGAAAPLPGQAAPYPYPFPQPPTGPAPMRQVFFEMRIDANAQIGYAPYLVAGRRLTIMASAAGFARTFSRPVAIQPGLTNPGGTTPAPTPNYDLPVTVIASGPNCQAPAPGAQVVRDPATLNNVVNTIGLAQVGTMPAVDFNTQSVLALCLTEMNSLYSVVLTRVTVAPDALEVHIAYKYTGTPPAGAAPSMKPWALLSIPVQAQSLPVRVIEEPIQYAPAGTVTAQTPAVPATPVPMPQSPGPITIAITRS